MCDALSVKKVLMGSAEDGAIYHCDAIFHEGDLWLVPEWLTNPYKQWKTPRRMIRLDPVDYMAMGDEYLLRYPIPKSVLTGHGRSSEGRHYDILDLPPLKVSLR